jgi:hypothetical protein
MTPMELAVRKNLEGKLEINVRPDVQEALNTSELAKYYDGFRPQKIAWFDEETVKESALDYFFGKVKQRLLDLTEKEFVLAFGTYGLYRSSVYELLLFSLAFYCGAPSFTE